MAAKPKQVYEKQFQAQLREWDANLKQLKARAHLAQADVRSTYETHLKSLGAQRAAAQKKLDELTQHGEEAWESLRDGADRAWDEMRKETEKVVALFK